MERVNIYAVLNDECGQFFQFLNKRGLGNNFTTDSIEEIDGVEYSQLQVDENKKNLAFQKFNFAAFEEQLETLSNIQETSNEINEEK